MKSQRGMPSAAVLLVVVALVFSCSLSHGESLPVAGYGVAEPMWQEKFGSQRAVVQVDDADSHVRVIIPWRLKNYPAFTDIVVVEASTGEEITRRSKGAADRDSGEVYFKSRGAGEYWIYYLPYRPDETHGHYNYWRAYRYYRPRFYFHPRKPVAATLKRIEARAPWDSVWPMEVRATDAEREELEQAAQTDFMVFFEDRDSPVKMKKDIPVRWVQSGEKTSATLTAKRNEYRSFQLAILASKTEIKNLRVEFSSFSGPGTASLGIERMTCFNTGGVDPYGVAFSKVVDVPSGSIQPLWVGLDIPPDAVPGVYEGVVLVKADNSETRTVAVQLEIVSEFSGDRGDNDPSSMSRLRWLNSRLGLQDSVPLSYQPVRLQQTGQGATVHWLGRQMTLGRNGLPVALSAADQPVLAGPVRLLPRVGGSVLQALAESTLSITEQNAARIRWESRTPYDGFDLTLYGMTEFDGFMQFRAVLDWKREGKLHDFVLDLPLDNSNARFMTGMGRDGSIVPDSYKAKWPKYQDSFWIGSADAGLYAELQGADYTGPLLKLYKPGPSPVWSNGNRGGYSIERDGDTVLTRVSSGKRSFSAGASFEYPFALMVTPVKPLDTAAGFGQRYFHSGEKLPDRAMIDAGVNTYNMHHATRSNPYINWPFAVPEDTRRFVEQGHHLGLKMKIYYTVREITTLLPELWALRSLGDEILPYGSGGGFPWLREHLDQDYDTQWYSASADPNRYPPDASIKTVGNSRWLNYYVEGLRWMMQEYGIDGLYMDDVAFDRNMMKRIRRVMDAERPGSLIDLHSNRSFSMGPVLSYLEFFPYIDKLWFGEHFTYSWDAPEYWLVESSGIPFGLTGEMLDHSTVRRGGSNPWLGAVYGMTDRLGWSYTPELRPRDPRVVWQVWDQLGIEDSEMTGWWDDQPLVSSDSSAVRATLWHNPHNQRLLIAAANWSDGAVETALVVDWERLGINPENYSATLPEMPFFQGAGNLDSGSLQLSIAAKQGKVILLVPRD